MKRVYAGTLATIGTLLVLGPGVALAAPSRTDVILAGSQSAVDYHAEAAAARPADGGATIIGGNIQITSDRGTSGGTAGACDPDPRFGTHPRPDDEGCSWAEPAGMGRDFISFGRHIQGDFPVESGQLPSDTDTSPDGAFTPFATPTRESFNGRGGLDTEGAPFIEERPALDDEDLNFRIHSSAVFNYVAPQGNADNRWRRLCGEGIVEELDGNAPMSAPFAAGQIRPFVVQIWDADFKDPSNLDGGNQDYFIIDVFPQDTTFDVATCGVPVPPDEMPPPNSPPVAPPSSAPPAVAARPAAGVRVLGVRTVARGTARIAGARACPGRPFNVRVSGGGIRRVTFFVDGRRVGAATRADRLGRFQARIDPRRMGSGVHRVRAKVEFVRGAGRARTLAMSFRVCGSASHPPQFAG
jgi:hypothetical protein